MKARKKQNSLFGPVVNAGWSQDLQAYQVEVPVPKFIRSVDDGDEEPWTFNGCEGTEKGAM